MREGESGVNKVAASAANHSETRHSCKLSHLPMEPSKCRGGEGKGGGKGRFQMVVTSCLGRAKGTWCYLN